jgi:hypothetical protein
MMRSLGIFVLLGVLGATSAQAKTDLRAPDPTTHRRAVAKACRTGDNYACADLADMLLGRVPGTTVVDAPRGIRLATRVCHAGVTPACNALGDEYYTGKHLPRDARRALRLYGRDCAKGGIGCLFMAVVLDEGKHVSRDPARAAKLYATQCKGWWVAGCAPLARLHLKGDGVARDPVRAAQLLAQACEGQPGFGCEDLGQLYQRGEGVPRDPHRGAELFARSCVQRNGVGCRLLGDAFAAGLGVPRDATMAALCYSEGCALEDNEACARAPGHPGAG